MNNVIDAINSAIAACEEHGAEPNRVRISPATWRCMHEETARLGDNPVSDLAARGFSLEVWYTCPPDNIYVDRKPEGEELGELEERLRSQLGYPYANQS